MRALTDNATAQVARERERRQAAEEKVAAAAAMAAEAQVCFFLISSDGLPAFGCQSVFSCWSTKSHVLTKQVEH